MRVVVVLLLTAAVASANMGPPPKGKKYVGVTNTVKFEKEIKGYTLFVRGNYIESDRNEPQKFEVGTEKAVELPGFGKWMSLYAVPNDLVPTLKSAADWKTALKDKKNGIVATAFDTFTELSDTDERKGIERAWVIKSIDAKDIVMEEVKDKKPAEKKEKPLALSEPGTLIGGLAAAVSITLGGLWLVRRRR